MPTVCPVRVDRALPGRCDRPLGQAVAHLSTEDQMVKGTPGGRAV
jgi:hypothetical protein